MGVVTMPMRGISADFSGCEIIVGAALSGDKALYEAETGPRCHRCGEDSVNGSACLCGPGKAHQGLHWLLAHTAFGEGATKEHRYSCKRGIFTKFFGGKEETAADQVGCDVSVMYQVFEAIRQVAPDYEAWDAWLRQCFDAGSLVWRDYHTGVNYRQDIPGGKRLTYLTYSGRQVYCTKGPHAGGNCVTPDTVILTADLRHVPAIDVRPGDTLVAFDEAPGYKGSPNKYRRLRTATVERTAEVRKPSVTVITEDGRRVTCSADHRWLCRRAKAPHRGPRLDWATAESLQPGDMLLSLGTWECDRSYESGYLAGLYDGEGSIEANREKSSVRARRPDAVHGTGHFYEGACITAGLAETVRVASVEAAGIKSLILLQTSTRTFVANGFLSHNSAIQGTARELLIDGLLLWQHTKWGKLPVLPVHDQILAMVPEFEADEATEVLKRCMESDVLSTDNWRVFVGVDTDKPFISWPDSS